MVLGLKRANSVKEFLVSHGCKARLNTVIYGKNKPENTGHNANAWRVNRRAVTTDIKVRL